VEQEDRADGGGLVNAMHGCATHMPDACAGGSCATEMHERTDALTYADASKTESRSRVGNAGEIKGFVYLVHWPQARFTKVGFTTSSRRWQHFVGRGEELLGVIETTGMGALETERSMHRTLRRRGLPSAFASKADAAPYLGQRGGGWTECYLDNTGRDVLSHLIADLSSARRRGA